MASAKLNLHGGFFRKCGHLGLFEAKLTCVIHGLARYSFFCFRSKRVDRCVGVEHEESCTIGVMLKISTSGPSLFPFQPSTQILYLPLLISYIQQ